MTDLVLGLIILALLLSLGAVAYILVALYETLRYLLRE